ncbi:MAG: 50S ribosomal protein L5 [Candidatus Liptonbacteria bacterium]|nr:50S ribosomal protein L5 [Candidatus Liptonbacteria bacterium]
MKEFNSKNLLSKIVVNVGVGKLSQQANFSEKILPQIVKEISAITGQRAKETKAKKSIAGFKLREGQIVGLVATLRGRKMVDFFERLTRIVLPRVHDFKGISLGAVDQGGALHIGFKEQSMFPELNSEESNFNFSFGINIVPKIQKRAEMIENYRKLGVAFMTKEEKIIKGKRKKKTNNG